VAERTGVPKTTLTRSLDIQPENTTAAYRTVKARIDATQQMIPPDRLDTTAINDFLARQRKWWTLNTTERCIAAHQMVRNGTDAPSRAIDRAHVTRDEYERTIGA
jgi:hypothetical protein